MSDEMIAKIGELEDKYDMLLDEFQRIIQLTDNPEVKGICERALHEVPQLVPVIQQRDTAMRLVRKMEVKLSERPELPQRLSREQAEPLCSLTCKNDCHGDCDCSADVLEVWPKLRTLLMAKVDGDHEDTE